MYRRPATIASLIGALIFLAYSCAFGQASAESAGDTALTADSGQYGSGAQAGQTTAPTQGTQTESQTGTRQGFGVSGGSGFASINGAIGSSPQLSAAQTSRQDHAYYGRLAFPFRVGDYDVVLTGDYIGLGFHGDQTYEGKEWWNPYGGFFLFSGDRLRTDLTLEIWRGSADLLFPIQETPGPGVFRIGPRLQWCSYYDKFNVVNVSQRVHSEQSRNYGMPGIGIAGVASLGSFSSSFTTIDPRLTFAAALGKGDGMRLRNFEAFAELFIAPDFGWGLIPGWFPVQIPTPGLLLQAGVIYFDIIETNDQREADRFGYSPTGRADYQLWYPVIRATLGF